MIAKVHNLLQEFDFKSIFIEELGWDHYGLYAYRESEGGMMSHACSPCPISCLIGTMEHSEFWRKWGIYGQRVNSDIGMDASIGLPTLANR